MKRVFLIKKLGKETFSGVTRDCIITLRITFQGKSAKISLFEVVKQPCSSPRKVCKDETVIAIGSFTDVINVIKKHIRQAMPFSTFSDSGKMEINTPFYLALKGSEKIITLGVLKEA